MFGSGFEAIIESLAENTKVIAVNKNNLSKNPKSAERFFKSH
jgi:hypothetical protein